MRINSLFTKITLSFAIALSILVVLFVFYLKYEKQLMGGSITSFHKNIANGYLQEMKNFDEMITYVEKFNFKYLSHDRHIMPVATILDRGIGFETLYLDKRYYLHVLTPNFRMLFEDLNKHEQNKAPYVIFLVLFSGLLFLYFWLIKSLQPLKQLKESISKFSQGDLSINCKSDGKDEIAQVANEFDTAVRKIELLLNSRQLFLRTIMHELKTPIAKGRIVSELVSDEKQKNRMVTVFERLDFLINDFAKVEQVISKSYEIYRYNYYLEEIIEDAKSMLMLENINQKVTIEIEAEKKIAVDYDLITMVFKNLMDNALRYSSDSKVKIIQEANTISFVSSGKSLDKPIEEYFTPFHNTTKSKNHGMGLGLYIVKSILDIHGMKFLYEYKDENNIFKILI